jgi:hypothetical protein
VHIDNEEDDLDGFESCEEDEESVMRLRESNGDTPSSSPSTNQNKDDREEIKEENKQGPPTGDFIQDFYREMDTIPEGEELDYIKIGKGAV